MTESKKRFVVVSGQVTKKDPKGHCLIHDEHHDFETPHCSCKYSYFTEYALFVVSGGSPKENEQEVTYLERSSAPDIYDWDYPLNRFNDLDSLRDWITSNKKDLLNS